ncbi:MAG: type I restriction-modification system specificity subunit [Magnetococcales bacterium]|nr:type I restriction-modification system specificity subunit [Magnetococcales bacterium]
MCDSSHHFLPKGWKSTTLGEVAECTLGGTPSTEVPQFWGGCIPWMASGDVHLRRVYDVPGRITESGLAASNATLTPPPAVAVGLAGQGKTRGTVALTLCTLSTNQSIALLCGNATELQTEYLFHNLDLRYEELRARSSGGGRGGLSKTILTSIPIDLPQIDEQSRITQILDTLDTAIRETEAIIAKLKAVKQGMLHDLLTRGLDANGELRPPQAEAPHLYKESPLGWIPKEWETKQLGELAEVSRGKFTHRPRNDPAFFGGLYPFIQTGDVAAAHGEYISTYSQTLSERGITVSQEFPAGTIAVTIAANIADTAILACPMYFPDSVVGVVACPGNNIRFIELSIRQAKRTLDARAPQSAQKNINLQDLRPLIVALPNKPEQDKIAKHYEAIQSRIIKEQIFADKLRKKKSGLMDDLLTGRVRVTPLLEGSPP